MEGRLPAGSTTPDAATVLEAALAQSNTLCESWQKIRDSARGAGNDALEQEAELRIAECRAQETRLLRLLAGFD